MNENPQNLPLLVLGSAMWGWTVPRSQAFELLDAWYGAGLRRVDAATNYPIDKQPEHFRLAEHFLREWAAVHAVTDLEVNMKIGSLNNLGGADNLLTRSFLLMLLDEYHYLFGDNLHTLMVHWDNRGEETPVRETLEAFRTVQQQGVQVGLSGIRHPELYAGMNAEFGFRFAIQVKHNILRSDYGRYAPFHGQRCFDAYGITAGGLKLGAGGHLGSSAKARGVRAVGFEKELAAVRGAIAQANKTTGRPPLTEMYQLGLLFAAGHPDMEGVLVGPSSVEQLRHTLDFYGQLGQFDFSDVYAALKSISH